MIIHRVLGNFGTLTSFVIAFIQTPFTFNIIQFKPMQTYLSPRSSILITVKYELHNETSVVLL